MTDCPFEVTNKCCLRYLELALCQGDVSKSALHVRVMGTSSDKCVKIHGVTRREGKGIPSCVRQYEVHVETILDSV